MTVPERRPAALRFWWLGVAAAFVVAYAALTPPFQSPDEVGHFWRAYSIARGNVLPDMTSGRPTAMLPRGVRNLVGTLWVETAGRTGTDARVGVERLRAAWLVPLASDDLVELSFPAFYTPVSYAPQALACFLGEQLHLRPLLTFYLGRLFNGALALVLFATAVALARDPWPFLAIASLPMMLYLCGSFSADPMTAGVAFLTTALALEPDRTASRFRGLLVCSFALALCKPAYLLIPLVALFRIRERRAMRYAMLAAAIALGIVLSSANARRNFYTMRTDVPIGLEAQSVSVRMAPLHFAGIVAKDYAMNWRAYRDQFVGRLGWLDIGLPPSLVIAAAVLLLLVGATATAPPLRERLLLLAIALTTLALVSLSQYIVWTPIGAEYIEGLQGRYFLPLGPLALLMIGVSDRSPRTAFAVRVLFVAVGIGLNLVALQALAARYW